MSGDCRRQPGLAPVEAKPHSNELKPDAHSIGNPNNETTIRAAIQQANDHLNGLMPGWKLTADAHYQLANRFAWSWKVASLGVPVILVYLGFLNVTHMADKGPPFPSAEDWEQAVRNHARGIVPGAAWGDPLDIGGTPLIPLIRSIELGWRVEG